MRGGGEGRVKTHGFLCKRCGAGSNWQESLVSPRVRV